MRKDASVFSKSIEIIFEFSTITNLAKVEACLLFMGVIMQCPVCRSVHLSMSERQGVEIDYCPQCRGVWLDRGELDKLIERSQGGVAEQVRQPPAATVAPHPDHRERYAMRDDMRPHKKKSFLSDMFDFD
jgi:Zn-finger nucleic acid-binding protein